MKKKALRLESLVLVMALVVSCLVPGFSNMFSNIDAFAAGSHEIDIIDSSGNSITNQIQVMESEQFQLNYELIDCSMPEGGYVVWKSNTPLNASVDQTGLVRGHDSSKGAAVRLWLDNDVASVPVVGSMLVSILEGILYNDTIDLDRMDTEAIVTLVGESLGVVSGALGDSLMNSLRDRLNSIDTTITLTLYDQFDSVLATDSVRVLVTNSDKWYAGVIPNGAFIVNKDSLPTTVAVGGKLKLEGGVTPLRLGYGVTWSLEGPTIFDRASDYAEFDESTGEITFLKQGTVTVKVAPNADDLVDELMGFIGDLASLGNEVDTSDIADALVRLLGLEVSTSTVKFVVDIIAAVAGIGTNTASLITQAVKYVADWILEATINDKITFTIVDSLEIKSFAIGGELEVAEGETSQLYITDIVPVGANSTNVIWQVEDESVAYVDQYGVLIGRDAGGISGLNKRTTTVTAFVDGRSASAEITVTGKLITMPVDIAVIGPSVLDLGASAQYTAKVYPDRSNASVKWGLVGDDGEISYASSGGSVSNSIATIDSNGYLTGIGGGTVEIAVKAGTISTCQRTYTVFIGTLAQGIQVDQGDFLSVDVPLLTMYNNAEAQLTVSFNPPDATNQNVRWSVLEGNLEVTPSGVVSPKSNRASWGIVEAKSYDGGYTDTITVSFANYPVTGITVNPTSANLTVGDRINIGTTIQPVGTGAEGAKIGDASIKDVSWESSDEDIAVVDLNGRVTAVDSGVCTITATTRDGGYQATTELKIHPDKTKLNYAIELFESGKATEENSPSDLWNQLVEAYEQALEIRDTEFAYQSTCDEIAQLIIDICEEIGAYVPIFGVDIMLGGEAAPDYNSVKVSTSRRYDSYSVDFDYLFTPENGMYASIQWTSSSSSISVDQNGVCTPAQNSACAATITFTAIDYKGNKVTDSVVVSFANYPVTGVKLDKTEITDALVYNTGKLNVTVEPDVFGIIGDANIKDVVWYSSDENVVTVDQSGNLTYKDNGTATISVVTVDGGYKASCEVTVSVNKTALAETIAKVDAANLIEGDYTVKTFDAYKAAYERATAVLENAEVAQKEIDEANKELNETFESLKLLKKVENVTILSKDAEAPEYISVESLLYSTASLQLAARVTPLDSMYDSVVWSTDSSSIKVDENGKVTPASSTSSGYGWVTVTVTDERGNTWTDKVHVSFARYPVTDVTISPASVETSLDEAPVKLSVSCKHQATSLISYNATIQNVLWTSSDSSIVSVDADGQLTYHNAGQVTITATAVDGGIQATCVVTVAGDKSRLREAIAKADEAEINVQDHTYETSMAYLDAYNHAVEVEASVLYTQEQIDAAADALFAAMENLEDYIHMTDLNIYYNGAVAPEFIAIKVPTYQTYTSQSVNLSYEYAPADAMFVSIEWASSNSNVSCTNGVIKPTKNQACGSTITLTATDHYGNTIVKTVYVAFANYEATGISIDRSEVTVEYGGAPLTINATVSRDAWDSWFGPSVADVVWRTTDPDVATVDANGVVTFVEAGTCQIIASSLYGGHTAICNVTVLSDNTALQEVYAMATALNLKADEYTEESWAPYIEAYNRAAEVVVIENAKQRDIDAAAQALWDAYYGLERYIKIQKVVITQDGYDVGTHISKHVAVGTLYTLSSVSLGYRITPTNSTWASVAWVSSNSSVSVSQSGVCTPTENKACWSLITLVVTDTRGNTYTDTVYVAFANYPVTGITVSPTEISTAVNGTTAQITYSLTPTATLGVGAASIQDVTWESSDESVAIVSNGIVEFHNSGNVTITAVTCDGGLRASTNIKVYANKTALKAMIDSADALSRTEFTPATWSVLQEKKNEALAVFNAQDPTQAEVDAASDTLNAAISDLVEYVYISDVNVVCDGQSSQFINVVVGADEPYFASAATVSLGVSPSTAMYANVEWSYTGNIILNPVSGLVAPMVNAACYGTITVKVTDDFGNVYTKTAHVTFTKNPVTSVTLDQNYIEVPVTTDSIKLNVSVLGADGNPSDINDVIWSSSDTSVATVDQEGNVTLLKGGYAEITVESVNSGITDTCKIYVSTDKSELHALLTQAVEANYQKTDYIETTFNAYLEAYDNAVAVYSNNEAAQDVIDSAVEWLRNAISNLRPYIHIDEILIYNDVNNEADDYVTNQISKLSLIRNKTVQLSFSINPGDAMYESYTWSSDNSDITVDQNGLAKVNVNQARVAGITLTLTDYYGVKYSKTVYVAFVNDPVTGISISKSELAGYTGGTSDLSCTVEPDSGLSAADITDVIWSSSDEKVATVNNEGKVFFVDAGECYITVTTKDGGHSASCKVVVTATGAKTALAEAIAKAKAYDSSLYTDETYAILTDAISNAESVYNTALATTSQINDAIARLESAEGQLVYVGADYTIVNIAIESFNELDKTLFSPDDIQVIQTMIDNIDWTIDISQQSEVDKIAGDINYAISVLEELDADYTALNEAINKAQAIDASLYSNATVIDGPLADALKAVEIGYKISAQKSVDRLAEKLNTAVESLTLKGADKSALVTAVNLKLTHEYTEYYDAELLAAWEALVAEGKEMANNKDLTILDNQVVSAKAAEITAAYEALEASYNVVIDKSALEDAVTAGDEILVENYVNNESLAEFVSALADGKSLLEAELVNEEDQATVNAAAQRILNAISALTIRDADYTKVNEAIERFNAIDTFLYTEDSLAAVQTLIDSVVWDLDISKQADIDQVASDINTTIDNLVLTEETKFEAIESSGSTVDKEDKFIYGVGEGLKDIEDYVRVINGTIECTETQNGLGTGTIVDVLNEEGTVVDTYTLVIFGDVNGDSFVDAQDSIFIWMIIMSGDTSTNAMNLAADVNRDGIIDQADIDLVEEAGALNATVEQR